MLIAHLADLHLGYRAYARTGPGGVNQRELDVSAAAASAVGQVIQARPDLVLVAGDVFHSTRPSNGAITDAFRHFRRLRKELPNAPVVVVAGCHDGPGAGETGSILRLLAEIPGVHVVDDAPASVRLAGASEPVSVRCVPHAALVRGTAGPMAPDPEAAVNVLLAHGTVAADVAAGWDYVALGHVHTAASVAPNAWYAGSLERVGPDIWAEASAPKGWVHFDTATGRAELREVPVREVVELPGFSALVRGDGGRDGDWLTADEVDRRILEAADSVTGGLDGRIARLVITDLPRELLRAIDHDRIRALRSRAVHFQLEARPPVGPGRQAGSGDRPRSLEEEVERFLATWQPTGPDIDRGRLVELGMSYLRAALDSTDAEPDDAGAP